MTPEERIQILNDCSEQLLRIREQIEQCLHMSGLERRFSHLADDISDIVGGTDGISVLIKEIDNDKEDPIWTRPLVSPKNITRKDI